MFRGQGKWLSTIPSHYWTSIMMFHSVLFQVANTGKKIKASQQPIATHQNRLYKQLTTGQKQQKLGEGRKQEKGKKTSRKESKQQGRQLRTALFRNLLPL